MESPGAHAPRGQTDNEGQPPKSTPSADSPLFLSQKGSSSPIQIPSGTIDLEEIHSRKLHLDETSPEGSHPGEPHLEELNPTITIVVPPVERRWEYQVYNDVLSVDEVLEEHDDSEGLKFQAKLSDGTEVNYPYNHLISLRNGVNALAAFQKQQSRLSRSTQSISVAPVLRKSSRQSLGRGTTAPGYVDISNLDLSSEDELTSAKTLKVTRPNRRMQPISAESSKSNTASDDMSSEDAVSGPRSRRNARARPTRHSRSERLSGRRRVNYAERMIADDYETDETDDTPSQLGKRKRGRPRKYTQSKMQTSSDESQTPRKQAAKGTRHSERVSKAVNMREIGEDEVFDHVRPNSTAKFAGAKESYLELPKESEFRLRHSQTCDTCYETDGNDEKGQLVYCQGCTLSYHQKCLGPRTSRDHLVTKIAEQGFVLQCRRCIGTAQKKDPLAPKQGICTLCRQSGGSCQAFRERKTSRQEQKDREDNEGEDPVADISSDLVNNVKNVLFRCHGCYRAFHMHHLPAKDESRPGVEGSEDKMAAERFHEYGHEWTCKECLSAPEEIGSLVAWRPTNQESYEPGTSTDQVGEDGKEYLVRWKNMSYFRTSWMPGAWVWGITSPAMRKAFAKRDNGNNLPKMRTEDAIPEDYLRVDIVLDVEYTNVVKVNVEKVDIARIKEVRKALVKFKGLSYEDVVWEEPPGKEDTQRWEDFKSAYEDWVAGRYVHLPMQHNLATHLSKVRGQNFEKKIMMHAQPPTLTGGTLMDYQMEGLNWIYYRWHQRQNAILADEMGLGKTIQVISFLATLQQRHKCWPFLIVVPNSTCPNWRREIKLWAPTLRVVAYYGSSESRKLMEKHELFPGGNKDLRCHVVVTSYEAAQQEDFRKVFRGISWAGLIVDEGQRLKNDKNILYDSLTALKAPFKLLLTGTPLQNNPRELFNLLQFLDKSFDAQAMEIEYATLTNENVPQLHELMRKLLLRRTKAQVLTLLPPMAQIIVPVTMSVVQKKLYKSIIAKNSELIKSIFGGSQRLTKQNDRANLNNILMQLRKCLAHPFVYSREIEERSSNAVISHRNLVDASSKLRLLELMLPKLEERGHRVLIFSQFLDMLDMVEDFLDGLGLFYQRLDGSVSSLQKQKRIDEFNAPNSSLFAFLLSTRAGGVGINLATADTVIILDPDFNPHQDIQALSRAHRIGQKKKVLVFQLTTRGSAEEKIMQIGKKKMALDHALIEQMGAAEDDAGMDLESILRHGAEALFQDDDTHDIHYDSASVDKLLDRSQMENTQTGNDNSAESQFSFSRVWANDKSSLEDAPDDSEGDINKPDASIWENILKTRELEVAEEAAAKAEMLGRGKRKRQTVDYSKQWGGESPAKAGRRRDLDGSDSDTDFQVRGEESDGEESAEEEADNASVQELEPRSRNRSSILGPDTGNRSSILGPDTGNRSSILGPETGRQETSSTKQPSEQVPTARSFRRVEWPPVPHFGYNEGIPSGGPQPVGSIQHVGSIQPVGRKEHRQDHQLAFSDPCLACNDRHPTGYCPLKLAGVEHCGLCGIAHYGSGPSRICPHLDSVTQCRAMLETLKSSTESKEDIENAKRYLVGVIARLKKKKKLKEANALRPPGTTLQPSGPSSRNQTLGPPDIVSKGPGPHAGPYPRDVQMMNEENRITAAPPGNPIFPSLR